MAERVLVLQMPRLVWIGGLAVAGASAILGLVLWHPAPLIGVCFGLIFASFPLLARLDAVKLDGPYLSARKAVRWVGPIDLRHLVAFTYRPPAYRSPAVWMLVQRDAGSQLRWYGRRTFGPDIRSRLSGESDLRIVEVPAGGQLSHLPGLADHLAEYVLRSDALVEPLARAALDQRRG